MKIIILLIGFLPLLSFYCAPTDGGAFPLVDRYFQNIIVNTEAYVPLPFISEFSPNDKNSHVVFTATLYGENLTKTGYKKLIPSPNPPPPEVGWEYYNGITYIRTPEESKIHAERYKKFQKYFGDTITWNNVMQRQFAYVGCRSLVLDTISKIDVYCNKDYDKDHPVGANLNDVITLTYTAYGNLILADILKYKNNDTEFYKLVDRKELITKFNVAIQRSLIDYIIFFHVNNSEKINPNTYPSGPPRDTKNWGLSFTVKIYFTNGKVITRETMN